MQECKLKSILLSIIEKMRAESEKISLVHPALVLLLAVLMVYRCSLYERRHSNALALNVIRKEQAEVLRDFHILNTRIETDLNVIERQLAMASSEMRVMLESMGQELITEKMRISEAMKETKHSDQKTWEDVREGISSVSANARTTVYVIEKDIKDIPKGE